MRQKYIAKPNIVPEKHSYCKKEMNPSVKVLKSKAQQTIILNIQSSNKCGSVIEKASDLTCNPAITEGRICSGYPGYCVIYQISVYKLDRFIGF